jgi:hypothetical protein
MATNHGIKSYLCMADETTWGTIAASPAWYHVPVTSNGIVMNRDRRLSKPFTGLRQAKHARSFKGMPAGSIAAMAYGWHPGASALSIMQMMVDWATAQPEVVYQLAKTVQWAEGPNVSNLGWLGMRVNGMTIEGSADPGTVTITLDLMGKSEVPVTTAQTLPADRDRCVEVDFSDCTFAIGGSAVNVKSFRYTMSNALAAGYLNSTSPSELAAGDLTESLTLNLYKSSDVYNARNRAFTDVEETVQFVIQGLHNGTGTVATTFTVGTFLFNRCSFIKPEDNRGRTLQDTTLSWDILKPDSSTASKTITWSEV